MKALILEGGAMRSVHMAGGLTAFADQGFTDYFDIVIGSSAGACNGAYFLAGQTDMFWDMWSKSLLSKDFINFNNLFSAKKPVLNIDYLVDEIILKKHPLDIKKIINSRTKFYVSATNCHTGQVEFFINDKEDSFIDVLRASSAIPVLYNRSVKLNGREYLDGSISDSVPIKKALDLGAKEIYVFLTRHEGYRKGKTIADIMAGSFLSHYPKIKEALVNRHISYNECINLIESKISDVNITVIQPIHNSGITRITTNPRLIKAVFRIGYYDTMRVLKRKKNGFKGLGEFQSHQSFPVIDMPG